MTRFSLIQKYTRGVSRGTTTTVELAPGAVLRAHHTEHVTRPIGDVFAFLADGRNEPSWRSDVIITRRLSGSGVGAIYARRMRVRPGGRVIASDFRITRCEEPTRLDFEVIAGRVRPTGSFILRDTGSDSTDVTFTMELMPRGLMVLVRSVLNRRIRAQVASLGNLPTALEA